MIPKIPSLSKPRDFLVTCDGPLDPANTEQKESHAGNEDQNRGEVGAFIWVVIEVTNPDNRVPTAEASIFFSVMN